MILDKISGFNSETYFLRVNANNETINKKIIKIRYCRRRILRNNIRSKSSPFYCPVKVIIINNPYVFGKNGDIRAA